MIKEKYKYTANKQCFRNLSLAKDKMLLKAAIDFFSYDFI